MIIVLCQPHKYIANKTERNLKWPEKVEREKIPAVNLWQIWERFRVQWRPASIHRYSLSLSRYFHYNLSTDEEIWVRRMEQTHHMNAIEIHLLWLLLLEWDYCVWGWIFSSHKAIWWVLRGLGAQGISLKLKFWIFCHFKLNFTYLVVF